MSASFPPEMKRKLSVVRRRHNRVAITACLILLPMAFLIVWFGPSSRVLLICCLAVWAVAVGIYGRCLWLYDARLCQEVGLMCPCCSRPLYQGGMNEFTLYGKCPRCKRFVATEEHQTNEPTA